MTRFPLVALALAAGLIAARAGSTSPVSGGVTQAQLDALAASIPAQVAASAPVTSVNGGKGAVTVPSFQRQVSAALDATAGSVSWTFPAAFANQPTCWETIAQADATRVFAAPVTTAISKTSVTVAVKAASTAINVLSLGLLTIWSNPPAGTTVTLSCVAALP